MGIVAVSNRGNRQLALAWDDSLVTPLRSLAGPRTWGALVGPWGFVDVASDCPRLAIGVLVAFTVMTLAFLLTRLSGDLAVSIAGPSATQADVEIVRKAYGLDRPLYVQFFAWTGRALVGDFGQSYFFKDSVANLIQKRLPITVTLGSSA